MRMTVAGGVGIVFFACLAFGGDLSQIRLESMGARYGFGANDFSSAFHQAEAVVSFSLPWQWDLGAGWKLDSHLDLSLGWLGADHTDAFVGTLGPRLSLSRGTFPVTVEGGVSPTWLSHDTFGRHDLGIPLQFTSHIGLVWHIARRLEVGYRLQHMSNAGLSRDNQGMNMHMFYVGCGF